MEAMERPRRCGLEATVALVAATLAALLAVGPAPAEESRADEKRIEELMRRASGGGPALNDAELAELLRALPPDEIEVNLVMVPAVVYDRKGRPVRDLEADDFRLLEGGREQPLSWFSEEADRPLRIALLVDVSGSMDNPSVTERVRTALLPLARRIRVDRDLVLLLSFAAEGVTQHEEWNSHPLLTLRKALEIPRFGRTALTDALGIAAGLMPRVPYERHAIVLVSDGVDNASSSSTEAVIDVARAVDTPVYVFALGDEARKIQERQSPESPLRPLRHVAEQTGARFFVIAGPEDAERAAEELATDLRHQYVLAFQPEATRDGRFRPLTVEVSEPGLTVRTRPGYR
jgi:Ca-activated chloride channel family protein